MNEYFPKRKALGGNIKIELDLSNHATKADIKKVTSVDTSRFAIRVEWCSKEWSCQNDCIWLIS